jgi:hypothetical protein
LRRNGMRVGVLLASLALLAGCGGRDAAAEEEPVLPPEPLGEQAVQEVVRIRAAGAEAGVLSAEIFSLIAAAGQQPRAEGERTLRGRLPPLLEQAAVVWPRSYRAVEAEQPTSEVGRRQREILLDAVRSEQASLARLSRELARGGSAWPPVSRFGERSDALRKRLGREVDEMMAAIPAHEREALQRAVADSN